MTVPWSLTHAFHFEPDFEARPGGRRVVSDLDLGVGRSVSQPGGETLSSSDDSALPVTQIMLAVRPDVHGSPGAQALGQIQPPARGYRP